MSRKVLWGTPTLTCLEIIHYILVKSISFDTGILFTVILYESFLNRPLFYIL